METSTIITIVLGSTVAATVVGFILGSIREYFQNRFLDNKQREENLYSDLRKFLMLINISNSVREELWNDSRENFKNNTKYVEDQKAKGELLIMNLDDSRKFTTKLINEKWEYIDQVKKLLENNSKYIRRNHWPLVERFFKEYWIREIVTGKSSYHENGQIFSDEKHQHAFKALFDVLGEIYRKIKI